jgi:hypothetical protein
MAHEIEYTSGLNQTDLWSAIFKNDSGTMKVYDFLAPGFVEWNDGNVANYDIALTEAGGGGKYTGTFPASNTAGDYSIVIYKGSAFDGSDEPVGGDSVYWDETILHKISGDVALIRKIMVNKAVQNKTTGVITYYDDDGTTPILTITPTDDGSLITRNPS